jgi:LysM repeat protein
MRRYIPYFTVFMLVVLLLVGMFVSLMPVAAQQGGDATPTPQIGGNEYVLQPGDTLDGVAQEFDISYPYLLAVNEITDSQTVPIGTVLIIPDGAPGYGEFPPVDADGNVIIDLEGVGGGGEEIYILQPGDTLDEVAQQFDVSYQSLLIANDITNAQNVPAGAVLIIPEDAPPYGQYPPLTGSGGGNLGTGGGGEETTYIVQEGDTYVSIAEEFGVPVLDLLQANDIDPLAEAPSAGTELIIPAVGDLGSGGGGLLEGNQYVMQPGDTLDEVAQQFDISYPYLLAVNEIENAQNVPIGTVLTIPDGAPGYGQFPPVDADGNVIIDLEGVGGGGEEVYILQPGDTLDGVAQQFNVSYQSLLQANNIRNAQNVPAGTVIVIPSDAPPYGQFPANEGG